MFFHQFSDFLKKFGIIGLALAFIVGQVSSGLVTSLVDDIINPFIGLFLPSGGNLEQFHIKIMTSDFKIGHLISETINFLIIVFIIFLAYRTLSKYKIVEDKTRL